MAPLDELSAPGSSHYSSSTMYVGDGTWDATRNNFLLPNLMGLNFDTMRYNGMGNRFRSMPGYYNLILGHAILAVIVFLFIAPAAVLIARFYGRNPGRAMHMHIYLQIMTLALATVLFILGFMAVGPSRSLTNPHHGIGLAIYVIILLQAIGGGWIYGREKGKVRVKLPVKLVLHQWLGRAVVLLGIVQVALGLTLYGSPKWTFILYALWVFFLLVLYFVLSYRAMPNLDGTHGSGHALSSYGGTGTVGTGTVITEKKSGRGWLGPLAAAGGLAALIARKRRKSGERERSRSRSRSRSQSRSRVEVIPSRRGSRRDSESFIEEKFETKQNEGGFMNKMFKGAAVLGAGALAKSWYDRRQEKKHGGDDYTSVAMDTPSKRPSHRRHDSISEDSIEVVRTDHVHRMEEGRRPGAILPGPGDPVAAAAAMSAAAPRPVRTPSRRHSFDSMSYSYDSTASPSRRPQSTHKARNTILAGVGLGWATRKWRERRQSKEQDRLDRLEEDKRIEEERLARHGKTSSKYTGDGFAGGRRNSRRGSHVHSSDLSSTIDDPHYVRPGTIPPVAAGLAGAALASGGRSSSRHDLPGPSTAAAPPPPFFPQPESGSEAYYSSGGGPHRRRSSRRRRDGEDAAAIAAATAAGLAAEQEASRRRSRSRDHGHVASPPVSVKVKMHGDKDRNVTLRRLTEAEAAAERDSRRSQRRRRADSASSVSGSEVTAANRRYRRDRRADEAEAEKRAEASIRPMSQSRPLSRSRAESKSRAGSIPPSMEPLSPPNPPFAPNRKAGNDSAYYSGQQVGPGSVGSPGSHGTWSGVSKSHMSPPAGSEGAEERRRRRRAERATRPVAGDFN